MDTLSLDEVAAFIQGTLPSPEGFKARVASFFKQIANPKKLYLLEQSLYLLTGMLPVCWPHLKAPFLNEVLADLPEDTHEDHLLLDGLIETLPALRASPPDFRVKHWKHMLQLLTPLARNYVADLYRNQAKGLPEGFILDALGLAFGFSERGIRQLYAETPTLLQLAESLVIHTKYDAGDSPYPLMEPRALLEVNDLSESEADTFIVQFSPDAQRFHIERRGKDVAIYAAGNGALARWVAQQPFIRALKRMPVHHIALEAYVDRSLLGEIGFVRIWDILALNGQNLRERPLIERSHILSDLLKTYFAKHYLEADAFEVKSLAELQSNFSVCAHFKHRGLWLKKKMGAYDVSNQHLLWYRLETQHYDLPIREVLYDKEGQLDRVQLGLWMNAVNLPEPDVLVPLTTLSLPKAVREHLQQHLAKAENHQEALQHLSLKVQVGHIRLAPLRPSGVHLEGLKAISVETTPSNASLQTFFLQSHHISHGALHEED